MKEKRRAPAPPGTVKAPVTKIEPAKELPPAERALREQLWATLGKGGDMPAAEYERGISIKPIELLSEFEGGRRRVGVTVAIEGLHTNGMFKVYLRGALADALVYPAQRATADRRVTWAMGAEQVSEPLRQALIAFLAERGES
jgi:hypothetical protein